MPAGAWLERVRVYELDPQLVNLMLIVAIVGADWLTPPGVAVGILLIVPILLSAMRDDRPAVIAVTAILASAGYVVAAIYGVGGDVLMPIWLSNRLMVVLGLVVTTAVAFMIQRTRIQVIEGRDSALAEKDLNRLLMSLLAHDLRSPLTVAGQGFKYVEEALSEGRPIDRLLLSDVRARLRRSLRAIDIVLSLARSELPRDGEVPAQRPQEAIRIDNELRAEIASFEDEAAARGKVLKADLAAVKGHSCQVDVLVLRQVIAILVDNAVRHAVPGTVSISAELVPPNLVVRVQDSGPGLSAHRAQGGTSTSGMGLGLELCRTLITRARGTLEVECDGPEGTCFHLQLPAQLPRGSEDAAGAGLAGRASRSRIAIHS